jgi:hypothetical protein
MTGPANLWRLYHATESWPPTHNKGPLGKTQHVTIMLHGQVPMVEWAWCFMAVVYVAYVLSVLPVLLLGGAAWLESLVFLCLVLLSACWMGRYCMFSGMQPVRCPRVVSWNTRRCDP